MRRKYRDLRAANLARSKAAGAPVGDIAPTISKQTAKERSPKLKHRRKLKVPWLNGRTVESPQLGRRLPGSFENGRRR